MRLERRFRCSHHPVYAGTRRRAPHALPGRRFVWPVSRLLSEEALAQGIAGAEKDTLGGIAGKRVGDTVITPSGARLELVPESTRYAHMRAADIAVTIPGTNTLELGIAGVPSVVLLPLNKPEVIPLEGPGHWLSLLPVVGPSLKRRAVLLAAPHLPVSLPNNLSGEKLMVELKGALTLKGVLSEVLGLLEDEPERKPAADTASRDHAQTGSRCQTRLPAF